MICQTVRNGSECPFMTKKGCTFNGGICHEIVDQCDGCNRKAEYSSEWFCSAYPDPALKWKNGRCNLATHVNDAPGSKKAKINPLKASKRGKR